jgi:PAS domain S-box-containing protein
MTPTASFRRPVPPWRRGAGIATPIFWAIAAAVVRALLRPVFGDEVPYLTFYFAVLVSAWSGGLGSGAIAVVVSLALSLLFAPGPLGDRLSTVLYSFDALRFAVVGLAVAFVCHSLRVGRDRARRQREELEILFDSIGDGVITTDAQGRVTRLNQVAIALTGWTDDDANCRHIEDVFQIVHEDTRETVDSPVRAVLRTGKVVGLSTHAVLVGRDGKECAIDDSAAPITGEDGSIEGVVLIFRDISSRRAAERERTRYQKELGEADRRKDEFLATLAHELRGPLAPLRSAIEVMKLAPDQPDAIASARATLDRQLDHLARLVDDLIDVSRISRGKIELRRERTELGSALYHAREVCRPLAQASGQELEVHVPQEPIFLDADPVRIAQVFTNLLGNSCKYTPPGGHIDVTATREGDDAVVRFVDDGAGIPEGMLKRIFDLFTQVQGGQDSQGGLGIGLSLSRSLVEIHGGTIEAQSEGPGKGSTFVVRLPARPAGESLPMPAAAQAAASPTRRRVLVADDNRDGAASLGLLLTLAGHEAHYAHDGLEAVEVAERVRPDVALLDIGMPRLDGLEAARRIRAQPWGAGIKLVALTGWGQDDDRRKSQDAGFVHHMVKPIDYPTLSRLLADTNGK